MGVAFGGGSARGLAHVGVIRWFEEHRIPIDMAAGTSMGALVGGAYASGMDADELDTLLSSLDWDVLFGSSDFAFKNIRRKADARAYPSHLEFGLKRGLAPPTALNNGEQVELLLSRITAPYYDLQQFDDLPTPFRAVAVDIVSATQVVLDRGQLGRAMRASMSIPLIFPPVSLDGRLLVDGGAMNNVPADVVRAMGADRVVAINVGSLETPDALGSTMLQLAGQTLDAMMRASTRRGIAAADIRLDVPLSGFGSLAWRRSAEIIKEGYQAAEAMRDELEPLALSEADYAAWKAERAGRRRTDVPVPTFVSVDGFAEGDRRMLDTLLQHHVGRPLDVELLEGDLALLSGLDRYETIAWRLYRNAAGDAGLVVTALPKQNAPPFLMLGVNLENTTAADFRITGTMRYLSYDLLTSGSELRLDATIGSDPGAAAEFYVPIRSSPVFFTAAGEITNDRATNFADDQILARYGIKRTRAIFTTGVNLGRESDLRVGGYIGRVDADVEIGDPQLPELDGSEGALTATWRFDTQDSPVVPSRGTLGRVEYVHVVNNPDAKVDGTTTKLDFHVHQLSANVNHFWSLGGPNRVFVLGGAGTSFGDEALATDKFWLGSAFHVGAYRRGELRGSNFYVATGGYLRQVARLPDFLGGPISMGAWIENGDAFERWRDAAWRSNGTVGVVLDTIVGPVLVAESFSWDGRWRTYVGIGRIFR